MSIQSRKAQTFLTAAADHMNDRAETRDCPNGERSMGRAVNMYNAMTGNNMTEEQGWKFMVLLKLARSAQGSCNPDDFEDAAAYAALAGEAATTAAEAAVHNGPDLLSGYLRDTSFSRAKGHVEETEPAAPAAPVRPSPADLRECLEDERARFADPLPRVAYEGRSIFPDG